MKVVYIKLEQMKGHHELVCQEAYSLKTFRLCFCSSYDSINSIHVTLLAL